MSTKEQKEYQKQYYQANKEKLIANQKKYYSENRETILKRQSEANKNLSPEKREERKKYCKKKREKLKRNVLTHYSNSDAAECVMCGESDLIVLSIDHIDGNGAEHRRELKLSDGCKYTGTYFYRWLKRNDFPDGFQTLCMNCQYRKRHANNESTKQFSSKEMRERQKTGQKYKRNLSTKLQGITRERNKISVRMSYNEKQYRLGMFELDETNQAAMNYDYHALQVFGAETYLNFPNYDYSDFKPKKEIDWKEILSA